jgi:ABC-type maltose transport system permease subunit
MAAGLLMMIPCAVLFIVFQKQLIEGIMLAGVKG